MQDRHQWDLLRQARLVGKERSQVLLKEVVLPLRWDQWEDNHSQTEVHRTSGQLTPDLLTHHKLL